MEKSFPSIFVSSTIFDFKYLRSSLKWWLESYGYSVNMSEFNDFDKPLDINSYEACFKAIDNSDYFILLVGERVGGMYDEENSITRKEYQYAYQKSLKNEITIVSFVERDLWTIFSKRQNIKSEGLDGYKHVFLFLNEIRRVKEMKNGGRPPNNWVHTFVGFKDVIDVLQIEFGIHINLNENKLWVPIEFELKFNLKEILTTDKEKIYSRAYLNLREIPKLKLREGQQRVQLTGMQLNQLSYFLIYAMDSSNIMTSHLEKGVNKGLFLEYDSVQNSYITNLQFEVMSSLLFTLNHIKYLAKEFCNPQKIYDLSKEMNTNHKEISVSDYVGIRELATNTNYAVELMEWIFVYKRSGKKRLKPVKEDSIDSSVDFVIHKDEKKTKIADKKIDAYLNSLR